MKTNSDGQQRSMKLFEGERALYTILPGGLRMNVYNKLKKEILKGDIKHGERLKETKLAEKFGVSRTPIREAIKRLEKDGLVTWISNKGASVRSFSVEDIQSAYNLKAMIEGYAASLAAQRRTEDQIATLTDINKQFDEVISNKGFYENFIDQIVELDRSFHQTIIAASADSYIPLMLPSLTSLPLIYQTYYWYDDKSL